MHSKHKLLVSNSKRMIGVQPKSVHLVVTSPPYPMIVMWDKIFSTQNKRIKAFLSKNDGTKAFEWMHYELDKVWEEIDRVLVDDGIACINIGDATRTIDGNFQLFSSHSRIILKFIDLGFINLPNIIWRKPTNSPTKFMGSGMYAPGAYVTLDHEYILIFRKGGKRLFKSQNDKINRRESSYFWEERNVWFSDVWTDLRGVTQKAWKDNIRERTAAYPFELAYRLINMFSVKGEMILDPYLGTGTTTLAAIASNRDSIGIDIDKSFIDYAFDYISNVKRSSINNYIQNRILKHKDFVNNRKKNYGKDALKYINKHNGYPVMTKQEVDGKFDFIDAIVPNTNDHSLSVEYSDDDSHLAKNLLT